MLNYILNDSKKKFSRFLTKNMITITPNYYKFYNNISFKAHEGFTTVNNSGKTDEVNNYTAFFRDIQTSEFVKNYIMQNFPNGTKIAEFGCSMGQKPYTLAILLDDANIVNGKNAKYKITGYDFPEVIKQIPDEYEIEAASPYENFLFRDITKIRTLYGNKGVDNLRNKFYKYFSLRKQEDIKLKKYRDAMNKNYKEKGTDKRISEYTLPLLRALHINENDQFNNVKIFVKPRQIARNTVCFKPGNINNIDKLLKPEENGVIIFQNALYHMLIDDDNDYNYFKLCRNSNKLNDLFQKINEALPKNGLFVLGTLPTDHIYFPEISSTEIVNGNKIYRTSPIHKLLIRNGFQPVFYDYYDNAHKVYFPAVWQKVKEASM